MISLESFRNQLCDLIEEQFTDIKFVIDERRSTILEIRIFFTPEIFMEAYVNEEKYFDNVFLIIVVLLNSISPQYRLFNEFERSSKDTNLQVSK